MSQVRVTIDGHVYRIACGDGEEARLEELAAELDGVIASLKGRIGEIGDRRIAIMAGLTVLDRLRTAEAEAAELRGRLARLERAREDAALQADADDGPLVERLEAAAAAVERVAALLQRDVRARTGETAPADDPDGVGAIVPALERRG